MSFDRGRRTFLKTMGGAGLVTLSGCGEEPTKRLVSYLNPPENIVPGIPTWYASVCRECPAGCGTVVATREGRPIKIEGNPLHPVNQGSLCARGQAALQGLYNPHRVKEPLRRADDGANAFEPLSWEEALDFLGGRLRALREDDSLEGVAVVTPRLSGSLVSLLELWSEDYPGANVFQHEAISYAAIETANELCFGRRGLPLYRMDRADLLVSFGADFLDTWISPVEYARDYAAMRSYREGDMGRVVFVGPRQCLTAANADEMILIEPGTYGALALGIIKILLELRRDRLPPSIDVTALGSLVNRFDPETVYGITGVPEDKVRYLARLLDRAPHSLVLPGGVELEANNATRNVVAVNVLNFVLGNYGDTVDLPQQARAPRLAAARDLSEVIDRMRAGEIRLLIFYDVNPAYTLPPTSGFLEALRDVETVISCSYVSNETTEVSDYVLPVHSPLESWDDYLPRDGVYGLMQPTVEPHGSRHFGDVLLDAARASGESAGVAGYESYYDFLAGRWRELAESLEPGEAAEEFWERALRSGGHFKEPEPEPEPAPVELSPEALNIAFQEPVLVSAPEQETEGERTGTSGGRDFALLVYPSLSHYDGRGANRPWLQELPDPMVQNVWSTVIEISRETAQRMQLSAGDIVRVISPQGELECPAYVSEVAHPGVAAMAMGRGHHAYGSSADGIGAYPLALVPFAHDDLAGAPAYLSVRVRLQKTGRREEIPSPQHHSYDENRGIVQTVSLASLRSVPTEQQDEPPEEEHQFEDLFAPHEHPEHRWGMTIDLNTCIGCSACVVACTAENNVPVVGKELFLQGREMSWIRVERYFDQGSPGRAQFLPMLCQQCDYAPCEPVCPVFATYHSPEGLNVQVYNRCVGTRYCANNCPYSVRRFNWYTLQFPEPLNLQLHPDVTVREKGVMEKCSFCVQRIMFAKDRAKDETRQVTDGEVVPACAQTCPTRAIVFGDLNDHESQASQSGRSPRGYHVLEHLNTKPAITYLKKIVRGEEID